MNLNSWCKTLLLVMLFGLISTSCESTTFTTKEVQPNQAENNLQNREINHAMGTTTVVGTPHRVVVLTNEATDQVLALGVQPVGAVQSWWGDPYFEYIASELQGVPSVGEELQPSLEKIAALQPDLIIGSKVRHHAIYSQLSQIAPTIYSETLGADWQENLALYAKALNQEEKAEQMMNQWQQRVTDFQAKMGDKLTQEVSLVRFLPGQARLYHQDSFAGKILEEVGVQRPPSQQKNEFADEISLESISKIDGDVIFYMTFAPQDNRSEELTQQWINHSLWQKLNAVKNNKVYQVNDVYWNTGGGIQAANKMLDDLYKYLLNEGLQTTSNQL